MRHWPEAWRDSAEEAILEAVCAGMEQEEEVGSGSAQGTLATQVSGTACTAGRSPGTHTRVWEEGCCLYLVSPELPQEEQT